MEAALTPFEELLVALVRSEVSFVTVGGVACSLNGFVRTTEDVDILVAGRRDNIERLLRALLQFGEGSARELTPDDFTDEEGAIRVVEAFPLDLFVRIGGQRFEDLIGFVRHIEIDGVPVPFLGAAGLILLKQASHREKDRIDVLALRRLLAADDTSA